MITGEIIATEEDAAKNIIIWVCYKDEKGNEFPFYLGKELLIRNGHNVGPLYSKYENFLGKTPENIQKWIQINSEHQIGLLIRNKVLPVINPPLRSVIDSMIGVKFQKDTLDILIDPTVSGTSTVVATVKDDGTYVVK